MECEKDENKQKEAGIGPFFFFFLKDKSFFKLVLPGLFVSFS